MPPPYVMSTVNHRASNCCGRSGKIIFLRIIFRLQHIRRSFRNVDRNHGNDLSFPVPESLTLYITNISFHEYCYMPMNSVRSVYRGLALFLLHLCLGATCWCDAYRIGDPVDTIIMLRHSGNVDPMRSQVPLFGLPMTVKIPIGERFSLAFEEGLWALPWTEVQTLKGQVLEGLTVTFVYSKSGGGAIHSVTCKPTYKQKTEKSKKLDITIDYVWQEEEPIDIQSGSTVMFLATLIACVVFLIQACGLADDVGDADYDDDFDSTVTDSLTPGVPKWD